MKPTLALLLALAAGFQPSTGNASTADEAREYGEGLVCSSGFEALRADMLQIPGIRQIDASPEFEAYTVKRVIFSLTRERHYAHPMLVRREIVQESEAILIRMSACGYNTKENSDRLIAEFEELNRQIKANLEGRN